MCADRLAVPVETDWEAAEALAKVADGCWKWSRAEAYADEPAIWWRRDAEGWANAPRDSLAVLAVRAGIRSSLSAARDVVDVLATWPELDRSEERRAFLREIRV